MMEYRSMIEGEEMIGNLDHLFRESVTKSDVVVSLGLNGLLCEVMQEFDILRSNSATADLMSRDLADNQAEIYMYGEYDNGAKYCVCINDNDLADFWKLDKSKTEGTTLALIDHYQLLEVDGTEELALSNILIDWLLSYCIKNVEEIKNTKFTDRSILYDYWNYAMNFEPALYDIEKPINWVITTLVG